MDTTFIYVLTDPTTGAIRYLGKSDNPFKRLRGHLRDKEPSYKKNWIDSLKSQGLVPHMDLLDEVPVSQWQFWEREYIRVFRAIGIPLTNQCDGGENPPNGLGKKQSLETCAKKHAANIGKKRSIETRARIGASKTGSLNPNFGKVRTPEHCANLSAALSGENHPLFGTTLPLQTCAKISAALTGKKQSSETCAKKSASRTGPLNPMFGKKESLETRAKKSASMRAHFNALKGAS